MRYESSNLKLSSSEGTLSCHIFGEIDHHSAKGIRESIDAALVSFSPDCLIMDLAGITFMDSSGLGLVLGRYTKASEAGIEFSLCNVSDAARRMFDMAGLDRIIDYKEENK